MNFLGHLYFSNNNIALMQANLFGDFVKGSNLSKYPPIIQQGILLHRNIDTYIDHHPAVIELMHHLYKSLPKISGIAVDLYFDHLLARNWDDYHPKKLEDFIAEFYDKMDLSNEVYSNHFRMVLSKMKEHNWLYQYQFMDGLKKMCNGVSMRISFPNSLSKAPKMFIENEALITAAFRTYMVDARKKFLH
jgi:acyl carrier protein phosphodiesterase